VTTISVRKSKLCSSFSKAFYARRPR